MAFIVVPSAWYFAFRLIISSSNRLILSRMAALSTHAEQPLPSNMTQVTSCSSAASESPLQRLHNTAMGPRLKVGAKPNEIIGVSIYIYMYVSRKVPD